jgi:enoyl-CoA hydratase/carnithine racemase
MELARDRIGKRDLGPSTLGAQIHGPEDAARVGLLDEVRASDQVLARAREEAARLGGLSRMAYAATKKRLRGKTIEHVLATLDADMAAIAAGADSDRHVASPDGAPESGPTDDAGGATR